MKRLFIICIGLVLMVLSTQELARKNNRRIYSDIYDLATDIKEENYLLGNRYPAITIEEVEYIESTDLFRLSGIIPKVCSKLKMNLAYHVNQVF